MSYFKTVSFWNKMNHSVQLFGTGSQVALVAAEASHIWNYVAAGAHDHSDAVYHMDGGQRQ